MKTETRNERAKNLHEKDLKEILRIINEEDSSVAGAVGEALPDIEMAVNHFVDSFRKGGRIIYVGAGTSGRLGVLDAVELNPTFGIEKGRVIGEIAGGNEAIISAREGFEDDRGAGEDWARERGVGENDFVVGISASGRTPFVLGYIDAAGKEGAKTAAVTNNPDAPVKHLAELTIIADTGPEVIAGSTRMKAGTAQKMILNMISTAAMVSLGKVYDNLMVDVVASNEKLKERAKAILGELTEADDEEIDVTLKKTEFQVKPAILALRGGLSVREAKQNLEKHDGHLDAALAEVESR